MIKKTFLFACILFVGCGTEHQTSSEGEASSEASLKESPNVDSETEALSADDTPLTPSRFITVEGLSIAVYESKGKLTPKAFFLHGNSSSSSSFGRIFRSPLAKVFRFVAIDLPGSGKSANASSYNADLFRKVIVGSAEQLEMENSVLVGWSLGGDLALQAISSLPKAKGLFLIGTAPIGAAAGLPPPFLLPSESPVGEVVNYGFNPQLTPTQLAAYVTAFFRPGAPIPEFFFDDAKRTDPFVRLAVYLAATGQDPTFTDEIATLRSLEIPVAMLVGDEDNFVRKEYLDALAPSIHHLYGKKPLVIHHSGHAAAWEQPAVVGAILGGFLFDVKSFGIRRYFD